MTGCDSRPFIYLLASCVGLASCAASEAGHTQARSERIGQRAGHETPRLDSPVDGGTGSPGSSTTSVSGGGGGDGRASGGASTEEVVGLIEQLGAVYLVADGRCEEWEAHRDGDRILLARYYYPFDDRRGKRRRHRQGRGIRIETSGLTLEGARVWAEEEFDRATSTWRETDGVAGGVLCVAGPAVQRIDRGLHYAIGGAHIYFSRRACEDDISRRAEPERSGCQSSR